MSASMSAASPRVLHIITGLGTGGAEASLVRVIRGADDPSRHAVVSLTTRGTRAAELEAMGVRVWAIGLARGHASWQALRDLRSIARDVRADVIQGWMYHASLAASLLSMTSREKWPVLWNVRHALDAWDAEPRKLRWLVQLMARCSHHPQAVIYNSARSARQHEARGYASARTIVIPNGVDAERFTPDAGNGAATRRALGVPATAVVIGMAARVDPLKDHDTFLRVAAHLAAQDATIHFLLVGTGTEAGTSVQPTALDAAIAQREREVPALAGRLVRCGERRDMPAVYHACDIVMLTSRSEGSPNAVAEAMGCGVPCVLEKRLPLRLEISVIVARSASGQLVNLPVQQNLHRGGILAVTQVPAPDVAADTAAQAVVLAGRLAAALQYVGVLCVEFFVLDDGSLVANEMAPRPHNSGHYSIDACDVSQFDLQVRTLAGLPLVAPRLHSPAVMLNLLGELWFDDGASTAPRTPDWATVLALPGTRLHLYGKAEPRRGRKMGHLTVTAVDAATARVTALRAAALLRLPAF